MHFTLTNILFNFPTKWIDSCELVQYNSIPLYFHDKLDQNNYKQYRPNYI